MLCDVQNNSLPRLSINQLIIQDARPKYIYINKTQTPLSGFLHKLELNLLDILKADKSVFVVFYMVYAI